jgi:hypothetical protein
MGNKSSKAPPAARQAFQEAQNTGILNYRNQGLTFVPEEVFNMPNLWKYETALCSPH